MPQGKTLLEQKQAMPDPGRNCATREAFVRFIVVCTMYLTTLGFCTSHAQAEPGPPGQDQLEKAWERAQRKIAAAPDKFEGYAARAAVHEARGDFEPALEDLDKASTLAGDNAELLDQRGSVYFKLARFGDSLADFDAAIRLDPKRKRGHWKRGITCYYAGHYEDGQIQFELYQTFDDADVENAVWRYLCMARLDGPEVATRDILKIGDYRRVPMRQIYELFAGRMTEDDVLAAARHGRPSDGELNSRLFYAYLYLGLYADVQGRPDDARKLLSQAVEHRIGHYMWDVARVHLAELEKLSTAAPAK